MVALSLLSCEFFNKNGTLKKAVDAEVVGNSLEALKFFVDAFLKVTPSIETPDIKRSKFAEPSVWKKEIEKHILWLHNSTENPNKDYKTILEGILRCADKVRTENFVGSIKIKKYSAESYPAEWNSLFFDPMAKVDLSCSTMTRKCFSDNISIVKINAPQNYTYEINLINRATGKRINFPLYPETSNSLLATPGDHLLICRSKIIFPETNQIWYSHYSVFPISIPQEASDVVINLLTSVAKERLK